MPLLEFRGKGGKGLAQLVIEDLHIVPVKLFTKTSPEGFGNRLFSRKSPSKADSWISMLLAILNLFSREEALEEFAGCAIIISHDRMFLDRLATHMLAFEGNSHVEWFEGNFGDYEADKIRRLGADAVNPKRATYKPLTR